MLLVVTAFFGLINGDDNDDDDDDDEAESNGNALRQSPFVARCSILMTLVQRTRRRHRPSQCQLVADECLLVTRPCTLYLSAPAQNSLRSTHGAILAAIVVAKIAATVAATAAPIGCQFSYSLVQEQGLCFTQPNIPDSRYTLNKFAREKLARKYVLVVQRFGVGLVIERSLVRLPAGALSSQLGQLSLPSLRCR